LPGLSSSCKCKPKLLLLFQLQVQAAAPGALAFGFDRKRRRRRRRRRSPLSLQERPNRDYFLRGIAFIRARPPPQVSPPFLEDKYIQDSKKRPRGFNPRSD